MFNSDTEAKAHSCGPLMLSGGDLLISDTTFAPTFSRSTLWTWYAIADIYRCKAVKVNLDELHVKISTHSTSFYTSMSEVRGSYRGQTWSACCFASAGSSLDGMSPLHCGWLQTLGISW